MKRTGLHHAIWRLALLACLASGAAFAQPAAPPASPPAAIEPKAVEVLKAASARLAGARSLSFTAVSTYEVPARNGQPIWYTTQSEVTLRRPDRLRVITPGDGRADAFYYDGRTMMAYVPSAGLVAVADAPPSIDALVDAAWTRAAIYFPFADVILSDPYAALSQGLVSAFYIGQSQVVAGTVTDMVAIASDTVQAQIWIGAADHLPRMIRAVFNRVPEEPRYETVFSRWQLGVAVSDATFTSARALAARRMPFSPPAAGQPAGPPQAARP